MTLRGAPLPEGAMIEIMLYGVSFSVPSISINFQSCDAWAWRNPERRSWGRIARLAVVCLNGYDTQSKATLSSFAHIAVWRDDHSASELLDEFWKGLRSRTIVEISSSLMDSAICS